MALSAIWNEVFCLNRERAPFKYREQESGKRGSIFDKALGGLFVGIEGGSSQRRHLTVVIFDIVGSTSISEEVDPEDVERLLGDYQRICEMRISELQGTVLNIVAEEAAGCFGWPIAKEASAERALRCGRLTCCRKTGPVRAGIFHL